VNDRFERAIRRFDQENASDPNFELLGSVPVPRELLYARRLSEWVLKLDPNASEALRLAARCQHIRRWEMPRSGYPTDRPGYHRWKNALKQFHSELSAKILQECEYDSETIEKVRRLNLKQNFPNDPESRTLEDALCLVFLQYQLAELSSRTEPEKMINALRKSWAKMTTRARALALQLPFNTQEKELVFQALSTGAQGTS